MLLLLLLSKSLPFIFILYEIITPFDLLSSKLVHVSTVLIFILPPHKQTFLVQPFTFQPIFVGKPAITVPSMVISESDEVSTFCVENTPESIYIPIYKLTL